MREPGPPPGAVLAADRARLTRMFVVLAVCGVLAVAALTGYFAGHIRWCLIVFALACTGGVGAQVWFIAAGLRAPRPPV